MTAKKTAAKKSTAKKAAKPTSAKGRRKKYGGFAGALMSLLDERVSDELTGDDALAGEMTNDEAIAMALIRKAMGGDTAAAKYICEAAYKAREEKTKRTEYRVKLVVVNSEQDV